MKNQNIYILEYADMIREILLDEINSFEELKTELEISSSWLYPVVPDSNT